MGKKRKSYLLANASVSSSSVLSPGGGCGFDDETAGVTDGHYLNRIRAKSIGKLAVLDAGLKKRQRNGIARHFSLPFLSLSTEFVFVEIRRRINRWKLQVWCLEVLNLLILPKTFNFEVFPFFHRKMNKRKSNGFGNFIFYF